MMERVGQGARIEKDYKTVAQEDHEGDPWVKIFAHVNAQQRACTLEGALNPVKMWCYPLGHP